MATSICHSDRWKGGVSGWAATDVTVLCDGRILAAAICLEPGDRTYKLRVSCELESDGSLDIHSVVEMESPIADFDARDGAMPWAGAADGRHCALLSALPNSATGGVDALWRVRLNGNLRHPYFVASMAKFTGTPITDRIDATDVAIQADGGIYTVGASNCFLFRRQPSPAVVRLTRPNGCRISPSAAPEGGH